jgi:hypothetical protein
LGKKSLDYCEIFALILNSIDRESPFSVKFDPERRIPTDARGRKSTATNLRESPPGEKNAPHRTTNENKRLSFRHTPHPETSVYAK